MSPLVSVVIPTHNRAELLSEAIASVLAQTYGEVEILIIDDGSQDGTRGAVEGFSDSRIRYFHNSVPRGPAQARNVGLRNATGDFLAFLDDDDLWASDKLEQQLRAMSQRPAILFVSTDKMTFPERNRGMELSLQRDMVVDYRKLLKRCVINNSSVLMRREVIELVGYLDEDLYGVEDYDFWLRILAKRNRSALILRNKLLLYRLHGKSITRGDGILNRLSLQYERLKPVYRKHLGYDYHYVQSILDQRAIKIKYLQTLRDIRSGRAGVVNVLFTTDLPLRYRARLLVKSVARSR